MESKEYYRKLFPLLTEYELVFDSESEKYNCISYTVNKINESSWPLNIVDYWPVTRELTKEAFDEFYEYHGFEKCNGIDFSYDERYIKVALYSNNDIPTHASIQIDNFWWESKIGSLGIIKHDLFEIEDNVYGQVTQIYKKLRVVNEILSFSQFIKSSIL